MSRRRKNPLRAPTDDERQELAHLSRSRAAPAARAARAVMRLAVSDGSDYQQAARTAGRESGDAVSHLVARFNREGLAAPDPRHGGGHEPTYDTAARDRIRRGAARTPTPETDGTATWSLTILRRVLRVAPDGLPKVSTSTIWQTPHGAGYTLQRTRTWCPTGSAPRRREAGVVTVTDPDAAAKKVGRGRVRHRRVAGTGGLVRGRSRPVPGHSTPRLVLAAGVSSGPATARVRARGRGQGADPVPSGRRMGSDRRHEGVPERGVAPVARAGVGGHPGRVARAAPDGRCVTSGAGPVAGRVNLADHTPGTTAGLAGAVGAGQLGRAQDPGAGAVAVRPRCDAPVRTGERVVAAHGREHPTGTQAARVGRPAPDRSGRDRDPLRCGRELLERGSDTVRPGRRASREAQGATGAAPRRGRIGSLHPAADPTTNLWPRARQVTH